MATLIKLPQFGVTMIDATVVGWLKAIGDRVERGDAVAQIETDKLNQEVNANAGGILRRIVAPVGSVIKVMEAMAVLGTADESEDAIDAVLNLAPRVAPPPSASVVTLVPVATVGTIPVVASPDAGEVRASPLARRLSREFGIDLTSIIGSGPGGRIVEEDVRARHAVLELQADGWILASPAARRLAREGGIDLAHVVATGPSGRIVERDVQAAVAVASQEIQLQTERVAPTADIGIVASLPGPLARTATVRFDAMRRIIADRMSASLRDTAQLTLVTDADATALVELRSHLVPAAKIYGHRAPTYTDLIVVLVARILRDHPRLNSSLVTGAGGAPEIAEWRDINIGVAVALDGGLVVPVIRNADAKPLQSISDEVASCAELARSGRLSPDALQDGTFTITNLGQLEVDAFTPIINPPQAAILGIGRIAKRPAVVDDHLAVRSTVTLSLTIDHRIVDGAPGGAFLRDVRRAIETGII